MMPRLEWSAVDSLEFGIDEAYLPDEPSHGGVDLGIEVAWQPSDSSLRATLILVVGPDDEGRAPPYRITLKTTGLFKTPWRRRPRGRPFDDFARQAVALLAHGMREYLSVVTSRARWGAFELPPLEFSQLELGESHP